MNFPGNHMPVLRDIDQGQKSLPSILLEQKTDIGYIQVLMGRETSSNDPNVNYEAKEWVKHNRPELIEGRAKVFGM